MSTVEPEEELVEDEELLEEEIEVIYRAGQEPIKRKK